MVIFEKIFYKNFMSVGNSGIEFDFNKSQSTLIIGKNGSSKSSVLDAICFVLFGKAHRNINKNQLINSVNQKQCYVEIHFRIGSIPYKVVRGMRPNIFEIYQNNVLMNKNSDVRDYQKILEQQILKWNYKTFTQVVILGSASFTPFMQLSPGGRREVIEDILDIGVFSLMNQINKEKSVYTKDELVDVENKIKSNMITLEAQKKVIKNITESRDNQLSSINEKILNHNNELVEMSDRLSSIINEMNDLQESISDEIKVKHYIGEISKQMYTKESNVNETTKKIRFFDSSSTCPLCEQEIEHDHKTNMINKLTQDNDKLTEELGKIESNLDKLNNRMSKIDSINKQIQSKNLLVSSINTSIKTINNLIKSLKEELKTVNANTTSLDYEKQIKKDITEKSIELANKRNILIESKNIEQIASLLLKDSGIKTSIIREYLPIMNMTINKYLELMDFFVKFELDEGFNETIKSRYRDEFTYASFSEGEKQKIDISLLFAWRHIAKLKNSVNTNILFLDEVLNSNLDSGSVDLLLEMLDDMKKDSNIFVITHNTENIIDRFDRVIKFEKTGNFSTMKEF